MPHIKPMRPFLKISQLFVLVCILSCGRKTYNYPQNRTVANEKGMLSDSLGFYFSTFEPSDSSQNEFVRDTFWQKYLSTNLYAFKEPVLYNDYLGKEQYRFLWLRSFHLPMVFTIVNANGDITLTTKKLDRQPLFQDERYVDMPDIDSNYIAQGYQLTKEIDTVEKGRTELVTVIKADRKANIIYDSTKTLIKEDWSHFLKLLSEAKFWNLKPYDWAGHTYGAMWVIEAHTKEGYKYLVRQSPSGKIRQMGELLITLSGLKEEIY